ncbi:carbon starvation protein [Melghirimyces thermohalophilus]|uniref:Carbon starvation protein n=1 Tax=Melghirimyces thermohalophilus TaxID=1236220 RepID=A0A1G6NU93_9BACL|nr:carbon starvation protein A [Melghirimyces thermohalophilus]SDC70914.1 carbon starvation protein [Melghirimyces thermohalophilus]
MTQPLLMTICALVLFFFGYRFYSKYLAEKVFQVDPKFRTPAHEFRDGVDHLPTNKFVLWGHHFSSVAGAAPIVGPAIAVIWGWGPALLWVVLGTIFFAGMHDFGTLWASVRNKGKSVGVITHSVIGPRAKGLFLLIIFFLLLLVNAVFAVVIANLFTQFPESVLPYWLQLPVAMAIGFLVYKRGIRLFWPSIIGLVLLYLFIFIGAGAPIHMPETVLGIPSTGFWVIVMLLYGAIASRLPVWLLLQPRDYINSHMLFLGLGILYLGLFITQPEFNAPFFNTDVPEDTPNLVPLLFVTVACGAISGFHGLVGSGTSSKQLDKEPDARFVGYFGAMGEGLLALIAIMAAAAGFASMDQWSQHYASWESASSSGVGAFVTGAGNFLASMGIPTVIGTTFVSIMIVAFAATTLDTSMRLQRFILSEIGEQYQVNALKSLNTSTVIAFLSCVALAFLADPSNPGAGGMVLWPLFGTTNQLTAGLSLIVITLLLWKWGRNYMVALIPLVFVVVMTAWSMAQSIFGYVDQGQWHLVVVGVIILALNAWLVLEGIAAAMRQRRSISGGPGANA